jgi:ParB-like chromosome segregation protein Spo0J
MSAELHRHPLSAAFGDMRADEFVELVADIKRNGLLSPIVTLRDAAGQELVLDGWHRYRACIEAGVKPRTEPFDYVVEPAGEQTGKKMTPVEFVASANAHRRHLTREQRRQIVVELLKAKPGASDRAIAAQAKVSDKTVGAARRELEATADIPQLDKTTGKDGKARAKPVPKAAPMSPAALAMGQRAAEAHAARQPKPATPVAAIECQSPRATSSPPPASEASGRRPPASASYRPRLGADTERTSKVIRAAGLTCQNLALQVQFSNRTIKVGRIVSARNRLSAAVAELDRMLSEATACQ